MFDRKKDVHLAAFMLSILRRAKFIFLHSAIFIKENMGNQHVGRAVPI